jgi:hypothetical protein
MTGPGFEALGSKIVEYFERIVCRLGYASFNRRVAR